MLETKHVIEKSNPYCVVAFRIVQGPKAPMLVAGISNKAPDSWPNSKLTWRPKSRNISFEALLNTSATLIV